MLKQYLFNFTRIDVISAGNNQILASVQDIEVTILIHPSQVAGQQPTVAQGLVRLLRTVPIPAHHLGTTYGELPDFTDRNFLERVRMHDHGVGVGKRNADRPALPCLPDVVGMGDGRSFSQSVTFDQFPSGHLLEPGLHL
ncbi:hypothetical protein D3C74_272240 [compost metagenome]